MGFKEEIVGVSYFCPLNLPKVAGTKINWEEVLKLKPTAVFMLSSQKSKKGIETLEKLKINYGIYSFESLKNIPFCALHMSKILGKEKAGKEIFNNFMKEIRALPKFKSTKVVYILWFSPLIVSTSSSFIAETLNLMGFKTFPEVEKKDFVKASLEELFLINPDFIFYSEDAGKPPKIILENFRLIPLPSDTVNRPNLDFFKYFYNFKNEKIFN